ncbi:MAG: DNA-directed RNA polymerase subunit omega [Gallibacter sp.]|nr:DNA-directed RNA polymerase subunit omega [Gallibacter sp.]
MMLYPSVNIMRTKTDSRYTTVLLAAKRARDIVDGKPKFVDAYDQDGFERKPVSMASEEIAEDIISYTREGE